MTVLETLKKARARFTLTNQRGAGLILALTNDIVVWADTIQAIKAHLPPDFNSLNSFLYHSATTDSDIVNLLDRAIKAEEEKK